MLSVAIHKDIAEYQPKVIGKLTGRTLISITVALGLSIAVAVYMNLVLKIDPTDHLEFIYAVSLPCWCCGFWKPHGLPFEQFALLWLQHQLSDNRLFYKPSMFKSGFVKTPDEITQSRKGKLYDKICTLPKGKYLLTVESAPDGYDKPAKSTSFTVKGNGEKVSAFAFLAKHVDKTAKSSESEDNVEATPADDGASQNQNNQAENSSADMNRGASAPSSGNGQPSSTSTPTTTKTIHHPAETIRIAICDTCGADITDDIEGHKKSTGHPWYHYDAKVVKEAWDETVTVN